MTYIPALSSNYLVLVPYTEKEVLGFSTLLYQLMSDVPYFSEAALLIVTLYCLHFFLQAI